MSRITSIAGAAGLLLATSAYPLLRGQDVPRPEPGGKAEVFAVDNSGRPVDSLEAGSSLLVGARGLQPHRTYEFRLGLDRADPKSYREAVSFARAVTDDRGAIPPLVLWYESGVVGCSQRVEPGAKLPPWTFRTFDEAERALKGHTLTVSTHPVQKEATGKVAPYTLRVEDSVAVSYLPVNPRKSPLLFASDKAGCLRNSQSVGDGDLFVSGRNFPPGKPLSIAVVANQRAWRVGEPIQDVTGPNGALEIERVTPDASGKFTVRVWDARLQRRGVYDLVAHAGDQTRLTVAAGDIISYLKESGIIMYLLYPVGGPTMDIAGRPLTGSPYFEFVDSFAETEPVWAGVDPTYVPDGHPGGRFAAYYVVNHRTVAGWDPSLGGSTALADVSGGIEIHPVKAGCVNGTDVIVWNPPLNPGEFDVVVDFGSSPAETQAAFSTDGQYNEGVDFLDGADQVGFVVARDPYELGPTPIGQATYSQDDFFPTIGGATAVDLRAVVRYPATSAGADTPVAPGLHPIFLIEHGNHGFCRNPGQTHATCTNRVPNHLGYMRLLDILASHGVIAVSIDAYDLTGPVPGWIVERGDLILKHLELWSHMNDPATFPAYPDFFAGRFAGRVNLGRISVSGHSRGGEASVAAFMQNTSFTIGSVSSIAPVDFEGYTLPDVPYFVILPAGDGDVSDLSGVRIYDRAGNAPSPTDQTVKSSIYVYGANHNYFNTVWADDSDDSSPARPDFIAKADQQRIGEAYLAAFTRVHLRGETVYNDMLRGKLTFPSTAGFKIFHSHHERNHSTIENGAGVLGTPSMVAKTSVSPPNVSVHDTQALKLGWTNASGQLTYAVPATQRNVSAFEALSFRAAETNSPSNPVVGGQTFQVELVGGGKVKAVFSDKFAPIPKPYAHPFFTPATEHNVMTTVRIPLHSFILNKSGVTLNNIDTVRFRFDGPPQGEIYVDDIEFSR